MAKKISKKDEKKSVISVLWCKIAGIIFMLFPVLVYAALADYDAGDPSFNKVTTSPQEINNFLGLFGAIAADAVLSSFGIALIVFLLVPIFWGYGLYKHLSFPEYKTRIFAWFVGVLSFSCFTDLALSKYLGSMNLPYNLTGNWSKIISRPLNDHVNLWATSYDTVILACIIFFISVISFNFSAGITFKRWFAFLRMLWYGLCALMQMVIKLAKRIINIGSLREFKELNPSYLQNKTHSVLNLKLKREPSMSRIEPTMQQNLHSSTTISSANLYSGYDEVIDTHSGSSVSGLTIEIPQSMISANQSLTESGVQQPERENSFNPTFDFIKENGSEPQNIKKTVRRTTDDNISKTKTAPVATQEELLEVPNKSLQNNFSAKLQEQKSVSEREIKKNKTDEYILPDINLLSAPKETATLVIDENALKQRALRLEQVLNDFNINGKIVKVSPGPVVTLYELEPKSGTRTARVIGLSDDIARSMAVSSVRMAVVSGKSTIGIELPNEKRQTVWLRELLEDREFMDNKNILNVALGKDIGGKHMYADISKMPHLLVAGTTGSGKSVGVNSMILSLLYRMKPDECKFIMIDPKQLEFSMYNGIPHLLTPVITDPAKAVVGLKWAVQEMEDRYRRMSMLNVRNIAGYNKKVNDINKSGQKMKKTLQAGFDRETGLPIYEEQIIDTTPMPYIVIVVDEMADLMLVAGKEVEAAIQRLAQMARAAGIHLIMSTQRPSVDVITGVIKANFPSRLSFHVTTRGDSITILGEKGAEQLLGMGDMLYMPSGLRPLRIHGCFVPDDEVERIVEFIKNQGEPQYVEEVTAGELNTKDTGPVFDKGEMAGGEAEEDLYRQAVEVVRTDKKASISYVQRKLRIGYNRAANLIERMEREGVVTKQDHVGRREVIGVD